MNPTPPLRKPRHSDDRPMTEDEIQGLDGEALQNMVGSCIMGCVWVDLGEYWAFVDSATADRYPKCERSTFKPNSTSCDVIKNTPWPTDIAAAFTVDRPEWAWNYFDYFEENVWECCCEVEKIDGDGFSRVHNKMLSRPTPADHARARCIAALLLAAKIGE